MNKELGFSDWIAEFYVKMLHVIDANNLAGKLDLLDRDDFDIVLIDLIKEYSQTKKFILVFDSADPMGDKMVDENLTIIYTPRDNYYKNADDKIIEVVRRFSGTELGSGYQEPSFNNAIRVITDDIEIKQKIEKINLDENFNIELEQASDFANKLKRLFERQESSYAKASEDEEIDNKEGISDDEIEKINRELLDIWK